MKITLPSILYKLLTTFLFFLLINAISIGSLLAEGEDVVPELSTNTSNENTPIWDGYKPQPAVENNNDSSNANREGYAKPIATIVPSAKRVIQGDIIYFRLEYENAGASYYWLMENQRGADRSLRVDTSTLKLGKHRVRVSVTNKARQQANSQLFFEVLAKPNSVNEATETVETPVQPIDYQGTEPEEPSDTEANNDESSPEKTSPSESPSSPEDTNVNSSSTPNITIKPAALSLDQGEAASFKSSEELSDDYEFRWRFGTQLSDLDKFQISTKDVIPGTYKVYLRVIDKEGNSTDLTAQLIVRDPETEKTKVPDFIGKNIENIEDELKEAKLVKGKIEQREVTENQGEIITQFPSSGTEVNVNSKIDLIIGVAADIKIPDVTGKNIEEAKTILAKNAIKANIEKEKADAEEGIVLSQLPKAGETLKQGDAIKLVIAEKKVIIEPTKPLEAVIETKTSSVEQGTDVIFKASLKESIEDEDYTYVWLFGAQKGNERQFTIKTDELALGKHTIKLQVKSDKEREANSEVALEIRAKKLLVPTLKDLSLEEAKKAIKKAGLVLGEIKKQEGKVKKAVIKQQSPAFGEYVSNEQPIDIIIVIPEKEKIKPARADISFDKTTGKAGEPIIFTTKVTNPNKADKTSLKDIHYVYNINNVKKASVDARFMWTPEVEGTYKVSVTAYNEAGVIARSGSYTLDIDVGWEKPIAKLLPENIEVKQGDPVEFVSNSTYDLNTTLKYEWISSSGHSSNKKTFNIDTLGVNEGEYDVTLTITDDKGSQSTTTATLSIQEVLEGAPSNRPDRKDDEDVKKEIENEVVQFSADKKAQTPSVVLNTSRRIAQIGQKIQFTMQVSPVNNTETLYYYQLGDKKRRQWMKTSAFEHQYNSFGSYSVRAVIKQKGKVYYSDSVTIWVWSPWLVGIVGGLGLFLFILIVWWAKRTSHNIEPSYYNHVNLNELEEQIPLLPTAEGKEKKLAVKNDIITERREQDSVKSVLLKGIIQFVLGILLAFIILYIILKLMGLV